MSLNGLATSGHPAQTAPPLPSRTEGDAVIQRLSASVYHTGGLGASIFNTNFNVGAILGDQRGRHLYT